MEIVNGNTQQIIIAILFSVLMLFVGKLWGDGTVAQDLSAHTRQPGHPVAIQRISEVESINTERYNNIISRLERIEARIRSLQESSGD